MLGSTAMLSFYVDDGKWTQVPRVFTASTLIHWYIAPDPIFKMRFHKDGPGSPKLGSSVSSELRLWKRKNKNKSKTMAGVSIKKKKKPKQQWNVNIKLVVLHQLLLSILEPPIYTSKSMEEKENLKCKTLHLGNFPQKDALMQTPLCCAAKRPSMDRTLWKTYVYECPHQLNQPPCRGDPAVTGADLSAQSLGSGRHRKLDLKH